VKRCLAALFILTVALGGFASGAQQKPREQPQQAEQSVSGTVISTGNISFAIRADDGGARSFVILTSTSLPSGGFRPGDRVSVGFQSIDAEHAAATNVGLAGASDANAATQSGGVPGSSSVATTEDTSDHSDAWRGLLFVGLLATVLALAVTTLVNLLRSPRQGRPHTSV
jgi:hypothetical protein